MPKPTHDTFPIRLQGKRKAVLQLPVDLSSADVELIVRHLALIAECSADHIKELPTKDSND